ncbi:hypothetical protein ASPWEDRAFT_46181, partial [Aspergillus wentii DTO 134E9]
MQLFHLFFAALTLPLITAYPSRSNHLDRRVIVPTPDKKITSYDSYMQVLMGIKWNMVRHFTPSLSDLSIFPGSNLICAHSAIASI